MLCMDNTHLRLRVAGVIDLGFVVPVAWLRCSRVWNGLCWKEVKIVLQASTLNLAVVNLDLIGVVRTNNQCVKMSVFIILQDAGPQRLSSIQTPKFQWYLASDLFLDQQVFPLVAEDDVHLLGPRSTDVRT